MYRKLLSGLFQGMFDSTLGSNARHAQKFSCKILEGNSPKCSTLLDKSVTFDNCEMAGVVGEPYSGKTGLLFKTISQVQAQGGNAAFFDCDFSFDQRLAKLSNVQFDRLAVVRLLNLEEVFVAGLECFSKGIDLLVFDSLFELPLESQTKTQFDARLEESRKKVLVQMLLRWRSINHKNGSMLMVSSQERPGNYQLNQELRALCSIVLRTEGVSLNKNGLSNNVSLIKAAKNAQLCH